MPGNEPLPPGPPRSRGRRHDTVLAQAPLAAREASRAGSHRQALTNLEAVLPYADRLVLADRAGLLDAYAWELHIAHRFGEAVEAGEEAVRLLEQLGESTALAETLLRQSRFLYMAGDTPAAVKAGERAVEVAEYTGSPAVQASAAAGRAMLMVLTGAAREAIPALELAHDRAVEAGRTDIDALCHNYLGVAWCDLGSPFGFTQLQTSIELARSTGDYEAVARGYTNLAEMQYRGYRWDELAECLRDGLAFVREHGFGSHAYNLEVHQALLDLRLGRWDEAEQRLRQLLENVDDDGMMSVMSHSALGRLLARRGDSDAEQLVVGAWERALEQGSLAGQGYAAFALAEWAWLNDQTDLLDSVRDHVDQLSDVPVVDQMMHLLPGTPGWQRDADPYEDALRLADSGETEQMLRALETLDRMGAVPAAALVRRRLKELGALRIPRGAQARTRKNPGGLTDRQLDVLVLLTDGLTNPQIAAELVLSVRTVDRHVSAILDRLGTGSRREAAAAARSLGLSREQRPPEQPRARSDEPWAHGDRAVRRRPMGLSEHRVVAADDVVGVDPALDLPQPLQRDRRVELLDRLDGGQVRRHPVAQEAVNPVYRLWKALSISSASPGAIAIPPASSRSGSSITPADPSPGRGWANAPAQADLDHRDRRRPVQHEVEQRVDCLTGELVQQPDPPDHRHRVLGLLRDRSDLPERYDASPPNAGAATSYRGESSLSASSPSPRKVTSIAIHQRPRIGSGTKSASGMFSIQAHTLSSSGASSATAAKARSSSRPCSAGPAAVRRTPAPRTAAAAPTR